MARRLRTAVGHGGQAAASVRRPGLGPAGISAAPARGGGRLGLGKERDARPVGAARSKPARVNPGPGAVARGPVWTRGSPSARLGRASTRDSAGPSPSRGSGAGAFRLVTSPTRTGPGPFKFNFAQHTGAVACRSVNLGWAGLGWAGLELGTCRGPAFRLDGRRSVAAKAAAAHPAISRCSSCNKPLLILQ